jgi:hypothetical protein
MSGQLVGAVYAASPKLRANGLSKNGFLALLAIAEKCHVRTRQGSVRWEHLCDGLYGVSKRTAKRAVRELREVDLIQVVKPGWANQHDEGQAPIYQLWMVPLVASSKKLDGDNPDLDGDNPDLDGDKHPPATSSDSSLDGSIDGSIDGVGARASQPPNLTAVPGQANAPPNLSNSNNNNDPVTAIGDDEEPRCQNHRDPALYPLVPNCRDCRDIRLQRELETDMKNSQEQSARHAAAQMRRNAIIVCGLCDEGGWRYGPNGMPLDPAVRCNHHQVAS